MATQRADAFLVQFEENEPANPRSWNPWYKAFLTIVFGMLALVGAVGSAIIAPANQKIAERFGISTEATVLDISLYVLGFAFGPCLWAPIGEVYGRKISILPAVFLLGIFSIITASSQSVVGIFITRFFGGVFGSAPISNVASALGDIYEPKARGLAVTFYALFVDSGPAFGPIIGAALTVNPHLGWRWTEYIEAIWVFAVFLFALAFLPEVYQPVLLKRKALRLRRETGDQRYWHPHEDEKINLNNAFTKHFGRPVRMLFTEAIITTIAFYASFAYAILYATLEAFPIVYQEQRQWGLFPSTLPFFSLVIGFVVIIVVNLSNQPLYARAMQRNGGQAVPEARLLPMAVGGWLFVIGLFWFGWTANSRIPWAIPTVAIGFIGAGFNVIFQQCINFLVDSYGIYAASAVSSNTILRSFMAAGLPLATKPLFHNLGVGIAVSVLGSIAFLALPVPWLFMKYSTELRRGSKFIPVE